MTQGRACEVESCRIQWVASILHTTSEHAVFRITSTDAHKSAARIRLNWRPQDDLNGLVCVAEKTTYGLRSSVPSHFKRSLPHNEILQWTLCGEVRVTTLIYVGYINIWACTCFEFILKLLWLLSGLLHLLQKAFLKLFIIKIFTYSITVIV